MFDFVQRVCYLLVMCTVAFQLPQLSTLFSYEQQLALFIAVIASGELIGHALQRSARLQYLRRHAAERDPERCDPSAWLTPASHGTRLDDDEDEDEDDEDDDGGGNPARTAEGNGSSCQSDGMTDVMMPSRKANLRPSMPGSECSAELNAMAVHVVHCALLVKQVVAKLENQPPNAPARTATAAPGQPIGPGASLCALCNAARATHHMLPCMCKSVCEPCAKLHLFRYDDPSIPTSVAKPCCPACTEPCESMIAIDPQVFRLHVCLKLPLGAKIMIE